MRYVQFYFYVVIGSNGEGFGLAALIENAIFLVQGGDCGVPVKQFPLLGNEKIEVVLWKKKMEVLLITDY
jgi:hypothetical protein